MFSPVSKFETKAKCGWQSVQCEISNSKPNLLRSQSCVCRCTGELRLCFLLLPCPLSFPTRHAFQGSSMRALMGSSLHCVLLEDCPHGEGGSICNSAADAGSQMQGVEAPSLTLSVSKIGFKRRTSTACAHKPVTGSTRVPNITGYTLQRTTSSDPDRK